MSDNIHVGHIVKSKAGRDKDRFFMVYSCDDKNYVTLVDGVLRKTSNPKKKKRKHIAKTNTVLETIALKLQEEKKVFDAEIRKVLTEAGFAPKEAENNTN